MTNSLNEFELINISEYDNEIFKINVYLTQSFSFLNVWEDFLPLGTVHHKTKERLKDTLFLCLNLPNTFKWEWQKRSMFPAVFRIHAILVRIRILGSVHLIDGSCSGSGSGSVSCSFRQWLPRLPTKKFFFPSCFAHLFLSVGTFTSVFKDKKSLRSH